MTPEEAYRVAEKSDSNDFCFSMTREGSNFNVHVEGPLDQKEVFRG